MKRIIVMAVAMLVSVSGVVAGEIKPPFDEIRIDQKLGEALPLDLVFRNEAGEDIHLGDLFDGRPVILSMGYYSCPMLCSLVQNGLIKSLSVVPLRSGKDYTAITVSIDPRETPEMAAASKESYLDRYGRSHETADFHFLVGDETSIAKLADAIGFRFVYDEQTEQYAHGSGIMVITPDGLMAQYFMGVEYGPRDLKFALIEASGGKIGSVVDKLLLLCYQYDPETGRYGAMTMRIVRAGGIITMLAIGGFVLLMLRRESRSPAGRTA